MEPQDYSGSLKKADELRVRTKKFAIRIVLCFDHFRVLLMRRLSESKCCVLGHLWQQTIGPYAVLDPKRNFGQPILADEGVPTLILARAVQSTRSISELASWYEVPEKSIADAIEFEKRLGS